MSGRLAGQAALVAGASRGFGQAIATALAAEGAAVTVAARSAGALRAVVEEIRGRGGRAQAVPGDVTRPGDVASMVADAEAGFGPTDLLVSCAGVPQPFGPVWEVDAAEWWNAVAVHVRAPFLLVHALLPGMTRRRRGRVIVLSAIAQRLVAPYLSAYCVGKTAQAKLVAQVAAEAADSGVSTFALEPGFAYTALADRTVDSPEAQRWLPEMVRRLRERREHVDDRQRCAARCVELATGRYDALSGRYLELPDDLDALLAAAPAQAEVASP